MPGDGISVAPESTGPAIATYTKVINAETRHLQYVILGDERTVTYRGRANTFRTPGRGGTTGARLLTIYNASATTLVDVKRVMIDVYFTVVKAVTIAPPIIRLHRFTAAPTNGTVLAQVGLDTAETSDVNVTCRGDASADGSLSASALAATIPAGTMLAQEVAPRYMGGTGTNPMIEIMDRAEFLVGEPDVTLRQNQGLVLNIDYTVATSNPASDMWIGTVDWEEYTL